ncbi:unnamed protein product (macronuclear) [Paramecium tetraurelia]|uniref:Uncharacterized protein n=1 Tax=Paramecium tetraurelia TaxID=5888 RepID=A0EHB2_PARTE|nr:uncharacterized protein GSPATT00027027001 [Paramecium tetraurelia]CAK94703.1 unnamed protein product [Paramecium tetraurelia]|eukprot:XP_001462076.1 hypothetical protein (macronuclear) [Paramecium tetraurelia strain d4-2]
MEILNELFKKKPKKQQQTNEREYTDLSDIQMMIQYTQRRQGLGFDDIDRRAKFQQPFVKKLKKDQIVKKQEKQDDNQEQKQKEEIGQETRTQQKQKRNNLQQSEYNFAGVFNL